MVSAGDLVGASPAVSALLRDEPSVAFFGLLGNDRCRPALKAEGPGARALPSNDPGCDLVGGLGNHELDEGGPELRRLLGGGNHPRGPFLADPWPGARFPLVCANLVDASTGQPVFPPFVVREVGGVRVGVVGAVRDDLATKVAASRLKGLALRSTTTAVNQAVAALQALGVRTIVVLLHHGGRQEPYSGPTRLDAAPPTGIAPLVAGFDGEVDVVISGDEHEFTNALVPAADGRLVLVTQAFDNGRAFALVDLDVDPESGDVRAKEATIRMVASPDLALWALVEAAGERVHPVTRRQVATASEPIPRGPPGGSEGGGESPLGDLVADAVRAHTGADLALVNSGALRADLAAGPVTFGHLFDVLPFGGTLVTIRVSGHQLRSILEQQWLGHPEARRLHISGFEYVWDARRQPGARVTALSQGDQPMDPEAVFSLAMPEFLADGGDGFSHAAEAAAAGRRAGGGDLPALVAHLAGLSQPLRSRVDGRIRRVP